MGLLETKALSKITVQDIADACEINRNSFYYHFQDIPALIEEIIMEAPADESAAADETAPNPVASSKQADDSVPAGSSKPAEESVERTPSPKASKVKKMTPSASDVKKTRAAERKPRREKPPQQ